MNAEVENSSPNKSKNLKIFIGCLLAGTFFIYYCSNPSPQNHYDYTFRVAENILRGELGFLEKPPSWLNEFVPFKDFWYSVFPFGSVVTMMPCALLKIFGIVREMPAAFLAALSASASGLFLALIAGFYEQTFSKRLLMISGILFGTWTWTNLTMAGAWQLALGFAMVGELGAIYFTVYNRKPILAGVFFALAFGNRTEILLIAPLLMWLLMRGKTEEIGVTENEEKRELIRWTFDPHRLINFCIAPFILGVATLIYNDLRFESYTDFGYARIPGVLDEPWYNHGIFSVWYIPRQAYEMLFKLWERKADFPYLVPNGFSSSILGSSPFILFAFRFGARDKVLKYVSWAAIFILTILLWMHGNSGGWQFGYRYAMVLLPWLFVILLENSPRKITFAEAFFYILSIVMNAYAVWLFHWTKYVTP